MADQVDPHIIAALTFAELRRKTRLREIYPWLRNTVVCVESDLASDVQDRMFHLVPGGGEASIACYFPKLQMFVFMPVSVTVKPGPLPETPEWRTLFTSDDIPHDKFTMGQAFATADMFRENWRSLPPAERPEHIGVESTAEIEKRLTFT
jgi:hypothetical protein